MNDNKIHQLLLKVLQATEDKKIEWEKNPKDESSFRTDLGGSTIYIMDIGSYEKAFIILNDTGDEIGRYANSYTHELDRLLDLARSNALKIDESLNEIDDLLDSMI